MQNNGPFLEFRSVNKRFGSVDALVDCNLSIKEGEFITLLGPSGCGKTTTLRLIAGLLRCDSGEILLRGQTLSSATINIPPERREFGLVFQSFAVWPHMTVDDNVSLPLRVRHVRAQEIKTRVQEVLDLCRLHDLGSRHPHELSGGQLQRVALARALVYKPQLLLLDEPLSNLDANLRDEMRTELRRLHQVIGDTTFVLVTHDQMEAMSLSDRVVVMNNGKIEQLDSPDAVYRKPTSKFVAKFVGAVNIFQTEVADSNNQDADYMLLRLGDGVVKVPRPGDHSEENTWTLGVHPESIHVSAANNSAGDTSGISGKVIESYFLGRTQQLEIEVGDVRLQSIQMQSYRFKFGESVVINIEPDAFLVF